MAFDFILVSTFSTKMAFNTCGRICPLRANQNSCTPSIRYFENASSWYGSSIVQYNILPKTCPASSTRSLSCMWGIMFFISAIITALSCPSNTHIKLISSTVKNYLVFLNVMFFLIDSSALIPCLSFYLYH